jgi:hypothetical protein
MFRYQFRSHKMVTNEFLFEMRHRGSNNFRPILKFTNFKKFVGMIRAPDRNDSGATLGAGCLVRCGGPYEVLCKAQSTG